MGLDRQRELFKRWTTNQTITPNEATIGLLGLLHACSNQELRHLTVSDLDHLNRTVNIAGRPSAVPLDPATWTAIDATLRYRGTLHTANPHLLVNRRTKTTNQPVSNIYVRHLLQPVGTTTQRLRRLTQRVALGRDPSTGRKAQKWIGGFRTLEEAKAARTAALARVNDGSCVAPSRRSLPGWFPR